MAKFKMYAFESSLFIGVLLIGATIGFFVGEEKTTCNENYNSFRAKSVQWDTVIVPLYLTEKQEKVFKPGDVVLEDRRTYRLIDKDSEVRDFIPVIIERKINK